jgi:hypothetical protein
MKRFLFVLAITILLLPMHFPLHGQDGGFGGGDSIDVTGLIGDRGGRGGGFGGQGNGRGGIQMPDSKELFSDIQSALKKGKTPLDKSQEKPLRSMLDQEIVHLSDRVQLLRQNNNNNNNFDRGGGGFPGGGRDFGGGFPPDGGFPGGGGFPPGGFPPGGGDFGGGPPRGGNAQGNADQGNNGNNNALANTLAVQTETVTSLKNDDFLENKLQGFLTPEQVTLIQKVRAADKQNATCLGGLLDRISPLNQNNNGGRGNNNRGNNNFNFTNNPKKTNGQDFCMTAEATASERLEPIRKELAKGNLPLDKDKETIAEVFMKSQMKDLGDALRATLTSNFNGNRGGNTANRNNNPQLVIQSSTDDIYKKAAAMLNPQQAKSLKKWHYEQILGRGGIESLIGIEAMQDTPLTDNQIARLTAAWPEVRNQMQLTAKTANKSVSPKDLDNAAMVKMLDMLEPPQVASYQQANKMVSGK